MAILSLDLQRGASGDMMVAALLDAGADFEAVKQVLQSLPLAGFSIEKSYVTKAALNMCDFKVKLAVDNHDSDMAYLFPHLHGQDAHEHEHEHGHDHEHHHHDHDHSHEHNHDAPAFTIKGPITKLSSEHLVLQPQGDECSCDCDCGHHHHHDHDHDHEHEHCHDHDHDHHHEHRALQDVVDLINNSCASAKAKALAIKVFTIIAAAEAKAHGTSPDMVHFHEVGGLDSIADVLAFAVCVDNLDITKTYATVLGEGYGEVRCQHGLLPIPVPAVANICAAHSLPMQTGRCYGELVTPTGAAMVAALEPNFAAAPAHTMISCGYGAGKRAYEKPSFIRALLLQDAPANSIATGAGTATATTAGAGAAHTVDFADGPYHDHIVEIKSNIDDMSGELLGALMTKLLDAGAQDVSYKSIFMKKNRPAVELAVLCHEDKLSELVRLILTESNSIGVRVCRQERFILGRTAETFESSLGPVQVKHCTLDPELGKYEVTYPEYESLKDLATKLNRPVKEVEAIVRGELYAK